MQNPTNPPINTGQDYVLTAEQANEERLLFGILAGVVAAIIGAILWALITVWTDYQIGWMAVGVGFLVGFAIRFFGKGSSVKFGIIGAVLALLGCLAGNLLAICIELSNILEIPLFDVITDLNFDLIIEFMKETFSFIDILFYILAIGAGYQFAFRRKGKSKSTVA